MLNSFLPVIQKKLINEDENKRILADCTFIILAIISFVMTVLNIFTHKGNLTWVTGVFALLCLLNLFLTRTGPRGRAVSTFLFAIEILLMFSFFLVSGNPEGFSAIWIVMLPSLGMLFFNRKQGSIVCAVMLLILLFFLWTPYGIQYLQFPYSTSFRMRFPILYIAFYLMALFLETIQGLAFQEVDRLQKLYKQQSMRDHLTGLYNRQGMYSTLENSKDFRPFQPLGVLMLDIDFFKQVNDTYGHLMGDAVLRDLAQLMESELKSVNCRWGGEEFIAIYRKGSITSEAVEAFRTLVAAHEFVCEAMTTTITISVGVCESPSACISDLDELIERADSALYTAKESGRNRVVYAEPLDPAPSFYSTT